MKHPVDIDNWNRRENYLFFRDFANPYYSVTSQVDVTEAYIRSKALGIKFSHYAMYASLRAVNSIEALRYRQVDGKVWLYDRIRLNTAVAREDHSFASVIIPYKDTLEKFVAEARGIIAAALRGEGDAYGADSEKDTFVISVNPWYSFTGLQFQFPQNAGENIPLSVFGKIMVDMRGRRTMPVAMSFHHGFVDGYQVGCYWEAFQHNLDTLSK